jgi:hypothetical protein
MNVVKANNIPIFGEFWFALIFQTEAQLKQIAKELHIKII